MRKPTRAPGYYWIRKPGSSWTIGHYSQGWWRMCGTFQVRTEEDMAKEGYSVARRVKEPTGS